jgi:hypothetical protein
MTMQNELTLIMKLKDELSGGLKTVQNNIGGLAKSVTSHGKEIGLAVAGAGLAVEGLARSNQEMLTSSRQMAASLGITEEQFNSLARETANAGFALDEVIGIMETGRQQGIRNTDQLQEFANFWDLVADATGGSGPALAEASVGLRQIGIAAGEESKAMEAFGFITENTTLGVEGFLDFVNRSGPELRDMGMSIDDTAAVLGIMERELGLTGRTAKSEFEEAVKASEGSTQKLFEILGITQEQFATYSQAVADSGGVLERNAAIVDEGITPMQKLQHALSEIKFQFAPVIEQAAQFAPLMVGVGSAVGAVGPIMNGVSGATKGLSAAMMFLAANPVGLVLVALAAVVTAGILIWKNWDTISAKAKEIWGAIQGFLSETLGKIVGFFRDHWAKIVAILFPAVGLPILIAQNWGQIVGVVTDMFNKVKEVILFAFATVVGFVRDHWQKILAILFPPVGLPILIANNWGQIINVVNNILDAVKNAFQRAIDWIKGRISAFVDWVMGMLNRIKNVDVTPGFGVPGIPGLQHGGTMARAGLAMVGEAGPELVRLPRGARVFSNPQSQAMVGGAAPVINVTINYSGDASPLELGRVLERGLRRVAREFPA